LACCQGDGAAVGGDGAVVADGVGVQHDVAALGGCLDVALVDDACAAVAAKGVVACGDLGIGDVFGAGYECADLDLGAASEHDAVGVDEEDLAVGLEVAEDL